MKLDGDAGLSEVPDQTRVVRAIEVEVLPLAQAAIVDVHVEDGAVVGRLQGFDTGAQLEEAIGDTRRERLEQTRQQPVDQMSAHQHRGEQGHAHGSHSVAISGQS